MSEEKKKDISQMVEVLKQLDEKSLNLIESGANLLLNRQKMDEKKVGA